MDFDFTPDLLAVVICLDLERHLLSATSRLPVTAVGSLDVCSDLVSDSIVLLFAPKVTFEVERPLLLDAWGPSPDDFEVGSGIGMDDVV